MHEVINFLLSILLVNGGFILYTLIYYVNNRNWNGYTDKTNLIVAEAIMFIIVCLLLYVPGMAEKLKAISGLGIDIENSKPGFVTLGFGLSLFLASKHKKK